MDLAGKRVTLMGLGRHGGGAAAARFFARHAARLTITDLADAATLADALATLEGLPIERLTLGRHAAHDFLHADVLCVNPAVTPDSPWVALARARGALITSECELALNLRPCAAVGITGTTGKSSTAAMLASCLAAAGRRVWLGGNIGHSLLDDLPRMQPDDVAVVELSSFQLYWLSPRVRWPELAVITNLTPHHLDWHGTFAAYEAAKLRLLRGTAAHGSVVLGCPPRQGWELPGNTAIVPPWPLDALPQLRTIGAHQRSNAACAAAAAECLGATRAAICDALSRFSGLPHRLECLGVYAGRTFYDDSKATTPAAAAAALDALAALHPPRPIWLLAGGLLKGANLTPLVIASRACAGIACFGAARHALAQMLLKPPCRALVSLHERLDQAFAWCCAHSRPGDVLLLSPGCTSHDQYQDYAERGLHFRRLAEAAHLSRVPS
jgi:UDP-N-acetylmuramoylalanine--D-glutamate ligase